VTPDISLLLEKSGVLIFLLNKQSWPIWSSY